MSSNPIQVMVRIRPSNAKSDDITSVSADGKVLSLLGPPTMSSSSLSSGAAAATPSATTEQQTVLRSFAFDIVLPPSASQIEAYDITAKPLVCKVLSGYNATMFCYGQTGSGKSHTIFGNSLPSSPGDRDGILFAAIRDLYAHDYFSSKSTPSLFSPSSSSSSSSSSRRNAATRSASSLSLSLSPSERVTSVTRTVSFYEIYNERIFDLLDECGGFIPDPAPSSSSDGPLAPSTGPVWSNASATSGIGDDNAPGLQLRENPKTGPFIQGLSHHDVSDVADDGDDDTMGPAATASAVVTKKNNATKGAKAALPSFGSGLKKLQRLINYGITKRATSSTNMNSRSSRSHAVFILDVAVTATTVQPNGATLDDEVGPKSNATVTTTGTSNKNLSRQIHSRLALVDLAGSERQSQTSSAGQRLKEAGGINKSLLILGQVINALACNGESGSNDGRHVSYRSSKLTHLLQPSLGGNSFTAIIGTISPLTSNFSDTMGTMKFCQRAKLIKNCATVNERLVGGGVEEFKNEVMRLKAALAEERARVAQLESNPIRMSHVLPSSPAPPLALSSTSTPNPPTPADNTPISSHPLSLQLISSHEMIREMESDISRLSSSIAQTSTHVSYLNARRMEDSYLLRLSRARNERLQRLLINARISHGPISCETEKAFKADVEALCDEIECMRKKIESIELYGAASDAALDKNDEDDDDDNDEADSYRQRGGGGSGEWRMKYESLLAFVDAAANDENKDSAIIPSSFLQRGLMSRSEEERRLSSLVDSLMKENAALAQRAEIAERGQQESESRVAQLELDAVSSNASQTQAVTSRAELNSLNRTIDSLRLKLEDAESDAFELTEMNSNLERINSELKAERVDMNLNLSRVRSEKDSITLNFKRMEAELERVKKDTAVEAIRAAELEKDLASVMEREARNTEDLMSKLKIQSEKAEQRTAVVVGRVKEETESEMKQQLASSFKDNAVLLQRVKDLSAERVNMQSQITKLAAASEKLAQEKRAMVQELESEKEAVEQLYSDRIKCLEHDYKLAVENSDKFEKSAKESGRRAEAFEAKLVALKRAKDSTDFELENLQEDHDTMTEQIRFLGLQVESLEDENRRLSELCDVRQGGHQDYYEESEDGGAERNGDDERDEVEAAIAVGTETESKDQSGVNNEDEEDGEDSGSTGHTAFNFAKTMLEELSMQKVDVQKPDAIVHDVVAVVATAPQALTEGDKEEREVCESTPTKGPNMNLNESAFFPNLGGDVLDDDAFLPNLDGDGLGDEHQDQDQDFDDEDAESDAESRGRCDDSDCGQTQDAFENIVFYGASPYKKTPSKSCFSSRSPFTPLSANK